MVDIILPYRPRPWQKRFKDNIGSRKRAFLLWARRHGKDIACWNYLIIQAMSRKGSYYYLFPQQNQARKGIWEAITADGLPYIHYIPREVLKKPPNNTEMMVQLVNGSIIRILGADNQDALRGSNPVGVIFSEYAWHHPHTWPTVVEPILNQNGGWALFNTTPLGKNHAYDLWTHAVKNSDIWYTEKVTNTESNLFTEEALNQVRSQGTSEEIVQQEYFCSWDRGVDGTVYGRWFHELRQKGKIRSVDYDNYLQVHTAWDLGFGDSTAIWFYQLTGNEIHIIDYYENRGEGLAHYCHILDKKKSDNKWIYGTHFVPHDAGAGSFNIGMSHVKYAHELGLPMIVLPREKGIDLGIERCRKMLPKCYFDEKKCEQGIKCLENYRYRRNETMNCYSPEPLHDWSSHASDAFRYLCQAVEAHHGAGNFELEKYREMKLQHGIGGYTQNNSILGN